MSYRRSRKRRRSQAFPQEDEEDEQVEEVALTKDNTRQGDLDEATTEEVRKEIEIWEAFREEHYEGTCSFIQAHERLIVIVSSSY